MHFLLILIAVTALDQHAALASGAPAAPGETLAVLLPDAGALRATGLIPV